MNMPVVKYIVDYVRQREQETGKNIKLTLTTNGTLLTDEIVKYLNDNRVMLVLSLDGSKKTHDHMRPYPGHVGSYDAAVKGFKKVIESRHGKNYYLRGTYTHYNTHFCDDVLAMLDVGSEISMEPGSGHHGTLGADRRRLVYPGQRIRKTGPGLSGKEAGRSAF